MNRLFAVSLLTAQLALGPGYPGYEGDCAQNVFFSLLFPQLMPPFALRQEHALKRADEPFGLFERDAGEAIAL